jgi:hypothetical protein
MVRWVALFIVGLVATAAVAAEPADAPVPAELAAFDQVIVGTYLKNRTERNRIRRNELFDGRAAALRKALNDQDDFTDWHMEVNKIGVDKDGSAWLALVVPAGLRDIGVYFSLVNLPAVGGDERELRFAPGTDRFAVARSLSIGDRVIVSGNLFADPATGYLDIGGRNGHDVEQRLREPWFVARFTSIKKDSSD